MKSIKQEWELYKVVVVPAGASPIQLQETRRAFYAGAEAMTRLMHAATTQTATEEEGMQAFAEIERELQDFTRQVQAGEA